MPRVAKKSGGKQPHTPLRPYGVIPSTTGKGPGSGVWPSSDGNATVAAIRTPSSIGISTSLETLLYVGSGSLGGGGTAAADETGSATAASASATITLMPPHVIPLHDPT